jgi:hypothetical protein
VDPERRLYQRLHLTKPLDGWFDKQAVRLIDVSANGALMESSKPIKAGSSGTVRFFWRDQEVKIKANVIRSDADQIGVTFTEDSALLRRLIAESAEEVLRAQQANLDGARELNVVGEETLTAASAGLRAGKGFVTYTFENGQWVRRRSLLPDQPANGFTVAAGESQDQIDMLCQTFQSGDEESQRMTRLLAELSAASILKR